MRYQVSSKNYHKGDTVKIVPWMSRVYPEVAGKVATIEDISGATAEIACEGKRKVVDLTHLQREASVH